MFMLLIKLVQDSFLVLVIIAFALSIIIKLDLCDIAFLCQASPPKALIVQYGSDGHSIIFMPVSNMVKNIFKKLISYLVI